MAEDREQSAWNDAERDALERWGEGLSAPPGLREATLRAARRRGLIGGRMNTGMNTLLGLAAALAIGTVVGFGAGTRQAAKEAPQASAPSGTKAPAPAPAPAAAEYTGPKFALLLFEDSNYQFAGDEKTLEARVGEYVQWSRDISKDGRWVRGNKLADEGKWCRLEGGHLAVEGPVSDGKRGLLAGYFLIGAKDLDEAIEVARGCPHFKYGGTVEVRRLDI
jgi:hypothetical protein